MASRRTLKHSRHALIVLLVLSGLGSLSLEATPYATSLTNSGTSISFRLNEDADEVRIISSGGTTVADLGPLAAGLNTADLIIAGDFQVVVTKSSELGWVDGAALQISNDDAPEVKFWAPRGVDVNKDPTSPNFGRIYVANAQNGTAGGRAVTDGIYLLNSDLTDAVGQGDTARTGGIEWVAATQDTLRPWQIGVGEDGNLYISDWTEASGGIYMVDGDVSAGSGVKVVDGYIPSSPIARGSLAEGDLKLYALEGLEFPINRARLWDIGGGPLPYEGDALQLHDDKGLREIQDVHTDLEIGPDGKIYLLEYDVFGDEDGLIIADPDVDLTGGGEVGDESNGLADLVYFSLGDTRDISGNPAEDDFLQRSRALQLSPSGAFLAIIHDFGDIYIVPLINGLPDLANRRYVPAGPGNTVGRDIAFDAAGNIYTVHSGNEKLRVFSPGLKSTATTGSDGSFSVTVEPPNATTVEVIGTDVNIYERLVAEDTATLTFSRVGDTAGPLTVNYSVAGTAVSVTDFLALSGSIQIPAGELSATGTITGINNAIFEGDKTIVVTVDAGAYSIGSSRSAIVTLRDDEAAAGPVLWEDNFETDTSASYSVQFSEDAGGTTDFLAAFNYDYGTEGIPPAPHSTAGTTRGLKLRVNFDEAGSPAGVNVLPLGQSFMGDFALRADMYISVGTDVTGGRAEHSLLGIHHGGAVANRHGDSNDGVWFAIDDDASDNRGYARYEGLTDDPIETKTSSEFVPFFTSPPWGFAGAPNNITNETFETGTGKIWADAEISSIGDVVTFKVNNTVIFSFNNVSTYNSGTIMLGHNDQFSSVGSLNNYTIFDNVRVIRLDDDPTGTTVQVAGNDLHIYERIAEDTANLTFSRVAADVSAALTIQFTVGGSAVNGTDYQTIPTSIEIPANETSASLSIVGIDNALFEGDKTIEISITADAAYAIGESGSATVTLRDDESAPGTVLWMDDFETDTSANYSVRFLEAAGGTTDFLAAFNYDYSADGIPPAPHSAGGTTHGLKVQVNFDGTPSAAAVNVYPMGQNFSGDFALRADMYISVGTDAGSAPEHTLLGIHHTGTVGNRHTVSNDGLWFAIDGEASDNRGFGRYEGGTGTPIETKNNNAFTDIFTAPPWGFAGSPNNVTNLTDGTSSGRFWADAEIRSIGGVVTIRVNNTEIFSFNNASAYTMGTVMLGHNDEFNSIGSLNNYTIFDNVRVVGISAEGITIDSIRIDGENVIIDFTGNPADSPASFSLQKSAAAGGPYATDGGAAIAERAPTGTGLFRATTAVDGDSQFYFIRK